MAGFDADTYARATAHHRAHDDEVLAPLRLRPGHRVLDLGCGAGDLTLRLADLVDAGGRDGGRVIGVDASPSCARRTARLLAANGRQHGAAAVAATAQSLGALVVPAGVDVVLSVATLHWVPERDWPQVLAGVRQVLRPGGLLRVDMGGHGQIEAARCALAPLARSVGAPDCPWFFPDEAQVTDLLARAGLRPLQVRRVLQRRSLPDAAALRTWLVSQVLPAYLPWVAAERRDGFVGAALERATATLLRPDGSYDQDYVRLHVLASSPGPAAGHRLAGEPARAASEMARVNALLAAATERRLLDDAAIALWHKRFRRACEVARRDPERGGAALAAVATALRRLLDGA